MLVILNIASFDMTDVSSMSGHTLVLQRLAMLQFIVDTFMQNLSKFKNTILLDIVFPNAKIRETWVYCNA